MQGIQFQEIMNAGPEAMVRFALDRAIQAAAKAAADAMHEASDEPTAERIFHEIPRSDAEIIVMMLSPLWKQDEYRSTEEALIHIAMGCAHKTLGEARFSELHEVSMRAAKGGAR